MNKLLASLVIPFLFAACAANKPHVDLLAGARDFDSRTDYEQTDQQIAGGIQVHFAGKDSFGPEAGIIVSQATDHDGTYVNRSVNFTESKITELYLGVRQNMMLGDSFQVFGSFGLSATMLKTTADLTYADARENNSVAYAPYLQAGVNYLFNEQVTAGLMYRRSFWGEDQDVWVNDPPTDSNALFLTVGYSF